jgi:hypothetical protein
LAQRSVEVAALTS